MTLNLAGGVTAYETMIDNFAKTLSHSTATLTNDNFTGSEELSYATATNITGAFFKRDEDWSVDKQGLFEKADAILMVKMDVTIAKNDRITYDGETFLVDKVITRSLNGTNFYQSVGLFRES